MLKAFLLLPLVLSTSCGSMPQTVDAFRDMAKETAWSKKTEFTVKAPKLSDVKARMQKMAQQCYEVEARNSSSDKYGVHHWDAIFFPTIQESPDRVTLALQRRCTRGCGTRLDTPPKDGDWVFLADVTTTPEKGSFNGILYSIRGSGLAYGDVVDDTVEWLKGGKKLCPEIK
jgi:hypothetical protein